MLQQREMQRQVLMGRFRQQQLQAARMAATERAEKQKAAAVDSLKEDPDLKNKSRSERKVYAIRERRRLTELAKAERN